MKRSVRTRAAAMPAAVSAPGTASAMSPGPQTSASSKVSAGPNASISACVLPASEAAVAERHLLVLAGEDMEHGETAEMPALQVVQLVPEDYVPGVPVAVEQQQLALRLRGEHGARDGDDRRDAAAGREQRIAAPSPRRERAVEAAVRRHDGERVPGLELPVDPAGEAPVRHFLHGDAKLAVFQAGADRVGPPDFFPVEVPAQRQELALHEAVGPGQRLRHLEGDRHATGRLPADLSDGEIVETRPYRHLKRSNGSRHPRQRQSALQGVEPNRLSSSTEPPPQCGQATGPRTGGAMP